ncbi:MAG: DUF362 domain-containing protein [Promethearchaeia archaeon]
MPEKNKIYRSLQKEIDKRMPIGFPKSEKRLDIKILKRLFSPKEAAIAIHLSALPETLEKVHKRLKNHGISYERGELEKKLDDMLKRGLINGDSKQWINPKRKKYSLAQFAVGMYEFQVDKQDKTLAALAEEYLREKFYKEFHKKDVPTQMRTIPVEKSLEPEYNVATYDHITQIIERIDGPFSVINCVCRQSHDLIGEECQISDIRRCCIMLHPKEEILYEVNEVKEVSKEKLLEMLELYQKEGFVLQPENTQNPRYLCVCCGCCCGVLQSVKQFPRPAEYYHSNFYADVDLELCNGCETCKDRCQMDAVNIVKGKAKIDLERCIGCGNCIPTCGMKAIKLKKRQNITVPPKNRDLLYQRIMTKKKGIIGTLGIMGKMLFGRKI